MSVRINLSWCIIRWSTIALSAQAQSGHCRGFSSKFFVSFLKGYCYQNNHWCVAKQLLGMRFHLNRLTNKGVNFDSVRSDYACLVQGLHKIETGTFWALVSLLHRRTKQMNLYSKGSSWWLISILNSGLGMSFIFLCRAAFFISRLFSKQFEKKSLSSKLFSAVLNNKLWMF